MKAYYYENGLWTGTDSLWQGLKIGERMEKAWSVKGSGPFVVALAGAGGKTSTIRRLAYEAAGRGLKTLVATTTHMACPEDFAVLDGGREEIAASLRKCCLAVAGKPAGNGKIAFIGRELYEEACPLADLVLVEADGSRRLPLKVPRAGEPVILDNTDLILCLMGLSSLGRRAGECCLRLKEARGLMDRYGRKDYRSDTVLGGNGGTASGDGWTIQREDMMVLMKYGYLIPLRRDYPGMEVLPVFNQADTQAASGLVRAMLDEMGETRGIAGGQLDRDESSLLF